VQQPETAAAKAGTHWLSHRQRGTHCDRGVESVAALGKDLEACLGCERVSTGNSGFTRMRNRYKKMK